MKKKVLVSNLLFLAAGLITLGCAPSSGAGAEADADADTVDRQPLESVDGTLRSETHVFEEIAPGVYFAPSSGTGTVNLTSNALVVVNEDHALVVDSHITADAGQALVDSVARLTDKPVRYLVNTHFHFDHAHGNQSFPDDVDIIGHEYARFRLEGPVLEEDTYTVIGSPQVQQQIVAQIKAALDGESDDEARTRLEAQMAMMERHVQALGEVVPTPPNVTLTDKMTLHRGGREVQLLHLGRGHTGGDVVVFLPAEKIVFTGDLFYAGAPYLGDGYANEMPDTLERLKALDVDIIVGGHGPLVRDKAQIEVAQEYLRTYWSRVESLHGAGRSLDEAMAELDMSEYDQYAAFQVGNPAVRRLEVARMYTLMEGGD